MAKVQSCFKIKLHDRVTLFLRIRVVAMKIQKTTAKTTKEMTVGQVGRFDIP
jgi:hypothetical protein